MNRGNGSAVRGPSDSILPQPYSFLKELLELRAQRLQPFHPEPSETNVLKTAILTTMFSDLSPDKQNPSTPGCQAPASALAAVYGEQVAREFQLIEEVLRKMSIACNIELGEGDLDAFCRNRQAKLNLHSRQGSDEPFERVRLLNMLYERCLTHFKNAANSFAGGESANAHEKLDQAEQIIDHLVETLDHAKGGDIAPLLLGSYNESLRHLKEARKEGSASKTLAALSIIEQIYLGYLEVELQQDAEKMLKAKAV